MAILFSSIIVVQILAHLPLADILLPANALQQFDIMIGIVSFDYFQPADYIDFGFSEMPNWSDNFEWLGYETINFVEGMGSILIFALLLILHFCLAGLFQLMRIRCRHTRCQNLCSLTQIYKKSLTFVHGTFFEILICVSISMRMMGITE